MNKVLRVAVVAASLSLLSGIARADRYPVDDGPTAQSAKSTVTRAETLADLQIWHESGLAAIERQAGEGAETGPGYDIAFARYNVLKASERFAALKSHFASSRAQAPRLMLDLSAVAPSKSSLSRAKVRAELIAWREAGLAAFKSSESTAQRSDAAYQAAKARYSQILQGRDVAQDAVKHPS